MSLPNVRTQTCIVFGHQQEGDPKAFGKAVAFKKDRSYF